MQSRVNDKDSLVETGKSIPKNLQSVYTFKHIQVQTTFTYIFSFHM